MYPLQYLPLCYVETGGGEEEEVISKTALSMNSGPNTQNDNLVLERTFRITSCLSAQTLPETGRGKQEGGKDTASLYAIPLELASWSHLSKDNIRHVLSSATEVAL